MPFAIESNQLTNVSIDGREASYEDVQLSLLEAQGDVFATQLSFSDGLAHSFDISLDLVLTIRKRDARPVLFFEGRTNV